MPMCRPDFCRDRFELRDVFGQRVLGAVGFKLCPRGISEPVAVRPGLYAATVGKCGLARGFDLGFAIRGYFAHVRSSA